MLQVIPAGYGPEFHGTAHATAVKKMVSQAVTVTLVVHVMPRACRVLSGACGTGTATRPLELDKIPDLLCESSGCTPVPRSRPAAPAVTGGPDRGAAGHVCPPLFRAAGPVDCFTIRLALPQRQKVVNRWWHSTPARNQRTQSRYSFMGLTGL